MIENLPLFLIKSVFRIITFLLAWSMHIQNNYLTPATFQYYIRLPITKKLRSLTADTVLWCTKILFPVDFSFLSIKKIQFPALTVRTLSHLTPRTPTKSNLHLTNSLTADASEPDLHKLLTFNAPNHMSLSHCLGYTKGSVQACGTCMTFVTRPVFTVGIS